MLAEYPQPRALETRDVTLLDQATVPTTQARV